MVVKIFSTAYCLTVIAWYLYLGDITKTIVVALPFALIVTLFIYFQLKKEMPRSQFEITAANKNPKIGLQDYLEQSLEYFATLNYTIEQLNHQTWKLTPPERAQVMGGDIQIVKDSTFIEIQGPTSTLIILQSILELKKIYL
jgi:hypothetical protein